MESTIAFFLSLKEKMGWKTALVIVISTLLISAFWKKLSNLLMNYAHALIQREVMKFNKSGLLRHPVFSKLKYLQEQRLKMLKCSCPLRKKIFGDLMIIRTRTMEQHLRDLVEDEELDKYTDGECQLKLLGTVYNIFIGWEDEARKEKIPEPVIVRFVDYVQDIREGIIAYVQSSTNSYSYFKNNYAKVYALLDIVSGFEELIIIRLELELKEMNGEISASEYKGIKCQHCNECKAPVSRSSSGD